MSKLEDENELSNAQLTQIIKGLKTEIKKLRRDFSNFKGQISTDVNELKLKSHSDYIPDSYR